LEIQRIIRRAGQRRELASRLKTIILGAWRKRLLLKTVGLTCRSARTRGSASATGTPATTSRSCFHQWYRFVLSFPPHLVRDYISKFGLNAEHRVLDPFCGTGTTLVECKKLGIPSFGLESNPVVHFASQTKLRWNVAPQELLDHALRVAETARRALALQGFKENEQPRLLDDAKAKRIELKVLPEECSDLLLTDSISTLPLHKTLVLLDAIAQCRDERFINHERLALADALVNEISNLHFGPEVGVGPAKLDAPVISLWLDGIRAMVQDLENLPHNKTTEASVFLADSREVASILPPNSIDAVITSPPYPNEKDYTRTTRLESVLLGFIRSKEDLRNLKKQLIRSNTRGVYKADTDDLLVAGNKEIERIAEAIEKRRIELKKRLWIREAICASHKTLFWWNDPASFRVTSCVASGSAVGLCGR
jgi:hypothetical protein